MSGERKRDLFALAGLFVIGAIFFADTLFFGRALYLRDLTRYYYPTKRIIREIILSGHVPYWNPYYSAGQPMAANPEYEVFYPPQWLILLPSYDVGYRLHIVFHVFLALAGMYCLLRSLRLSMKSSFFGAVVFGVGGLFLSTVNLLPIMFAVAWLPLIFLFARRCFLVPNPRDFCLASVFIGMQCLVGEPTSMVQTWFLLALYAAYRGWHNAARRREVALRNLVLLGFMLVLGALIGAAQIFPAIDHVGDSARSRPFDFSLVTSWSMPWAKPLELLLPNLFGHMSVDHVTWYWGSGMYPRTGSGFLYNTYLGLPVIALAIGAFAVRPRGGRAVLVACGVSMLLALGGHTPLFRILYDLGIGRSVRYPEKFMVIGLFALIVFAAILFERLMNEDRELITAVLGVTVGVTIFAFAVAILSMTPLFPDLFGRLWGYKGAALEKMVEISRLDWWIAVARGVIYAALLWWLRDRRVRLAWFGVFMIALTADLYWVGRELKPTFSREFLTPPPVEAELPRNRSEYRIFHEPDWYGGSEIAKKYFGTGSAVYWIVRNGIYPMTPATWGFRTVLERDYDKTALLTTIDFTEAMWRVQRRNVKDWAEIFMAMSNGHYRAFYNPYEPEAKRVKGQMKSARPIRLAKVGENPRYYFAERIERVRSVDQFVERLLNRKWPARVAFADLESFEPAEGRVISARETPNAVDLEVSAEGRSFLVLANTAHRYWTATLDGKPVPIRTTNITYQGIEVPAGTHRVALRYRNPIVALCVWISLGSALFTLLGAAFSRTVRFADAPSHAQGI